MTAKVTVSAPGKLMLLGEHAVLFKEPCLVTAVGQRLRATVELTSDPVFSLDAPDVKVTGYGKAVCDLGKGDIPKGARFVERAVENFLKKYGGLTGGVRIETSSAFSSEFGFGSSSASIVCVVGALIHLTTGKIDPHAVFELAYNTVLDIQGKASGFDVASAVFGGTLLFADGGKTMEPIVVPSIPLIIGYSGQKYETVKVIDEVRVRHDRHPETIDHAYRSIGALVPQALEALQQSDWVRFGELMDLNQGFLEVLGVSNLCLSSMIHAAREAGALGAKLSGSGKGDCMIALAGSGERAAVSSAIGRAGGMVIDVPCNTDGLRIEQ